MIRYVLFCLRINQHILITVNNLKIRIYIRIKKMAELNKDDVDQLAAIIEEKAVVSEKGGLTTFTVSKVHSRELYEKVGLTQQVVEQVHNADRTVVAAAIQATSKKACELVKGKSTEDARDVVVETRLFTDRGTHSIKEYPVYTARNPRTGDVTTNYGRVSVNIGSNWTFDDAQVKDVVSDIRAALGVDGGTTVEKTA